MVYRNMTDGIKRFQDLLDLDMDAVEDKQVALIKELCDKFIVTDTSDSIPNQLIRGSYPKNAQDKETKYLGQPSYKLAKEQWMKCK